jgi:hypothetical protein
MKDRLINLMSEFVAILTDSGWHEQAEWFADVRNSLDSTPQDSSGFTSRLIELERALVGMGSIADLPLESKSGKWTRQQLRERQWALVEQLGECVEELKKA